MKFKATKKAMNQGYSTIITVGYCDLDYLLHYEEPIAYSTRAEGWACDYYDIDGVLICTGYAPINEKNSKRDYMITHLYNEKARELTTFNGNYEDNKAAMRILINEYINKMIIKGDNR